MLSWIKTHDKGSIWVSISFVMLSAVSLSKCQSLGIEIIRNNFTESLQHTYQDVSEGRVYPAANDIWSYNNSHYNFLSTSTVTKKITVKGRKKLKCYSVLCLFISQNLSGSHLVLLEIENFFLSQTFQWKALNNNWQVCSRTEDKFLNSYVIFSDIIFFCTKLFRETLKKQINITALPFRSL